MDNPRSNDTPVKTKSGINLPIYLFIFLLSGVIVYLFYSLSMKITFGSQPVETGEIVKKDSLMQIEILNGCGATGIGEVFTNYMRKCGFDVIQTGNYISFDVMNTIIIDRKGNIKNAFAVADSLGIGETAVIQQLNKDYFLDVSLIIGKDYKQLKPLARGSN